MSIGRLYVIEACNDGVGKTTQYNALIRYLRKSNEDVHGHHFPTYNRASGQGVVSYLAGHFGKPEEVNPYLVNSLYAHDRAIQWHLNLKKMFDEGSTIVCDRYTTSSMIYQTANMSKEDRKDFVKYIEDFEYNKLKIQKPDKVFFLLADFELIQKMREKRNLGKVEDIHESDVDFLKKVYIASIEIAEYLNWEIIKCSENGNMLKPEEISLIIQQRL